jgi:transposase
MKRKLGTREWQYCCIHEIRFLIKQLHRDGFTYAELAKKFNISKSTVARYCRGVSQAHKSTLDSQTGFD